MDEIIIHIVGLEHKFKFLCDINGSTSLDLLNAAVSEFGYLLMPNQTFYLVDKRGTLITDIISLRRLEIVDQDKVYIIIAEKDIKTSEVNKYMQDLEILLQNYMHELRYEILNNLSSARYCMTEGSASHQTQNELDDIRRQQETTNKLIRQLISSSGVSRQLRSFVPRRSSLLKRIFGSTEERVNSVLYAPSQIQKSVWSRLQVYLYRDEEADDVELRARVIDPDAVLMSYDPFVVNLNKGDIVELKLDIYDSDVITSTSYEKMEWHGSARSCDFLIQVPHDYSGKSIGGHVELIVNRLPIGKLIFTSKVVDTVPVNAYVEPINYPYKKVFFSYAREDSRIVDIMVKTCRAQGIDYFYDKHSLKVGDNYKDIIDQVIKSSDVFILCWSKNAEASEYVRIEYTTALTKAWPGVPKSQATLRICPFIIDPLAPLPNVIAENIEYEIIE